MRFPIDFDDSEEPDIYKLTNRKVKLNDNNYSGHGGTMTLTMSFDAFNKNTDKHVTMENGQEVWICNYNNSYTPLPSTPSVPDETTDLSAVISGNKNLKNGYRRTYTVTFSDKDSNTVDWGNVDYHWNVVADFDIQQIIYENKIDLFIDDENLIGFSFLLQVVIEDITIAEIELTIAE